MHPWFQCGAWLSCCSMPCTSSPVLWFQGKEKVSAPPEVQLCLPLPSRNAARVCPADWSPAMAAHPLPVPLRHSSKAGRWKAAVVWEAAWGTEQGGEPRSSWVQPELEGAEWCQKQPCGMECSIWAAALQDMDSWAFRGLSLIVFCFVLRDRRAGCGNSRHLCPGSRLDTTCGQHLPSCLSLQPQRAKLRWTPFGRKALVWGAFFCW